MTLAAQSGALLPQDEGVRAVTNWGRSITAFTCAMPVLAAIMMIDGRIRTLTGFGMNDLQHVADLDDAQRIIMAWRNGDSEAHMLVGVSLGIDYLFMPLYGAAFFFGCLGARDSIMRSPGLLRSVLSILAWSAFIGMAMDAVENVLQFRAAIGTGPVEDAYRLTALKWPIMYVGMGLTVIGAVVALIKKRRPDQA